MSHSTLTTSELISLNIHDSFTFEGVEIAINPDIFNPTASIHSRDSGYHTRDSSHASSAVASSSVLLLNSSLHSINDGFENSIPNVIPAAPLKGGDVIEIRVWDRIERREEYHGSSSTPNRKNSDPKTVNALQSEPQGHPRLITTRPPIVPRNISTASSIGFSPKMDQMTLQSSSANRSPKPLVFGSMGEQPKQILTPTTKPSEPKSFLSSVASDDETDSIKIAATDLQPDSKDLNDSISIRVDSTTTQIEENVNGNRSRTSSHNSVDSKYQDNSIISKISQNYTERDKFVVQINDKSLTALKSGARTQFSILRQVADIYNLTAFDMITVTKIDESDRAEVIQSCSADYVTMTVKEQFINRGEMHQFQNSFQGRWFYKGERLSTPEGIRGTVMEIRNEGREFKSAFITEDTKITFRSRSARILWLVQISAEMWDYASPYENGASFSYGQGSCERYFDKFVSFMYKLFDEWKSLEVTHSLTVVFFCRTYIQSDTQTGLLDRSTSTIQKDVDGRFYEDSYKVVLENVTRSDWESLIVKIKEAFLSFPIDLQWKLGKESRLPSSAAQGNILEAINTGLNLLQLHYIDRDLNRVGNSIVVVSAGSGVFEVDSDLAAITKQRMMDNGIGSDMLSLGLPPLHVAPFMLYKEKPNSKAEEKDDWRAFFEIPHWMHLSFISYDNTGSLKAKSKVANEPKPQLSEPMSQNIEILSHGLIIHERKDSGESKSNSNSVGITLSQHQQRHLILGRDFEDILEACRPRHYSAATGGVPSALSAHLKLLGLYDAPQNVLSKSRVKETLSKTVPPEAWGSIPDNTNGSISIRLDESNYETLMSSSMEVARSPMLRFESHTSDLSHSDASGASSLFAANLSFFLARSPGNAHLEPQTLKSIQIQQDPSSYDLKLDSAFEERYLKRNKSNDSIGYDDEDTNYHPKGITDAYSINEILQRDNLDLEELSRAMDHHDFMISATNTSSSYGRKSASTSNAMNQDTLGDVVIQPSDDAPSEGIGAALNQFEYSSRPINRNESSTLFRLKKSMNAASSVNINTRSRSLGMGYSLDDNIGLNLSNHDAPPLELGSSFPRMSLHDSIIEEGNSLPSRSFISKLSSTPPAIKGLNPLSSNRNRSPNHESKKSQKYNQKAPINSQKFQSHQPPPTSRSRRKRWVLNPFRQEDEEEVLAKRTHNSRRWSHVFPKGEIEFKRHAGPNWKSLCQPAILPVTIDVYPTPKELNDISKFLFRNYRLDLYSMDTTNYDNHSNLVMEMVRQRIIQDFQLVPQSVIKKSEMVPEKNESAKKLHTGYNDVTIIQHTLSMGHRIHIISCDPSSDSVDVVEYLAKFAVANSHSKAHVYRYNYNIWMPSTSRFEHSSQEFHRFPDQYPWNFLDSLICGDSTESLSDDTRFRRRGFRIIPDSTMDTKGEEEHVKNFKRLVEFIEKQTKKSLPITYIGHDGSNDDNAMLRIFLPLRKTKRENFEWLEICMDKEFKPKSSYHIAYHWLVASAIKVETQIQMLQRRCLQYGLRLIPSPQMTLYSSWFLNPFIRPESIHVREQASMAENALVEKFGFVDDGKHIVYAKDVLGFNVKLKTKEQTAFRRSTVQKKVATQQYIHSSGTLFVRLLPDIQGGTTFVFLQNRVYTSSSNELQNVASSVFLELKEFLDDLNASSEGNKT